MGCHGNRARRVGGFDQATADVLGRQTEGRFLILPFKATTDSGLQQYVKYGVSWTSHK